MSDFLQLLLVLVLVIGVAKLAGLLSTRLGQPAVLGELLAGLLLGPSLLNLFHLPVFAAPHLEETVLELAELGVIFLMFIAGLEIEVDELRRSGKVAAWVGTLGVLVPLLAGTATAWLFGYTGSTALFIGVLLTATIVGPNISLTPSFIGAQPGMYTDANGNTVRPLNNQGMCEVRIAHRQLRSNTGQSASSLRRSGS